MSEKINELLDKLNHKYENNKYVQSSRITNNNLMLYIIIVLVFILMSRFVKTSLTTIFFIVVALVIVYFIYSRNRVENISPEKDVQIKKKLIIPELDRIRNYPDLVNFLFDIRDYYYVNPNAFYAMMNSINNFLKLYEQITNNQMVFCVENLEVAVGFSRDAQNNLHSLIYNLRTNKLVTKRFHKALEDFQFLMQRYIDQMIQKCNAKFNSGNIDQRTRFYDKYSPHPYNYYDYSNATARFQFY